MSANSFQLVLQPQPDNLCSIPPHNPNPRPPRDPPPEIAGSPPGTATPRTGAVGQRPSQHAQVLDCDGAAGICTGQVVPSWQHL